MFFFTYGTSKDLHVHVVSQTFTLARQVKEKKTSPLPLVIKQTEEATQVLTGLPSWPGWLLTNVPAEVDLVLTGGGLGGCR